MKIQKQSIFQSALIFQLCCLSLPAYCAEVSGSFTATYLKAAQSGISDDSIGVVDVDFNGTLGTGRWHIYLEGTSTSSEGGLTSIYGEAYADAGAASDEAGNGRIQISTLEYYHRVGKGEFVVGLLYPSAFTESAEWANDETTQFISSSLVNIPTNGNPDYALGFAYTRPIIDTVGLSLMMSQAQGLGDIDSTYSSLMDEFDDVFFSAELTWSYGNLSVYSDFWSSTLAIDSLDGKGQGRNRGVNLSMGYETGLGRFVFRYGRANGEVSEAEEFLGAALQQTYKRWNFGLGASKTRVSRDWKKVRPVYDKKQYELYARFLILDNLHLTMSIQKIYNNSFRIMDDDVREPSILSVRTSLVF